MKFATGQLRHPVGPGVRPVLYSIAVLAALVGAWAIGGPPQPALAQTLDGGRFLPVFGPQLAGDELVWVPDYRADRGYRVDSQPLFGGPARTIFSTATGDARNNVFVNGLVASPQQVLVAERGLRLDGAPGSALFRIGRDGSVEEVGEGSDQVARVPMDLSGNVGIYVGFEPGATIRDFASPPSERVLVSPVFGQMRVAGRYAAWEAGGDIVVYDRATNSEHYRVPGVWPQFDSPRSLDLQADGKVAFLYSPDANRTNLVAWASQGEPFPHRLPVDARRSMELKLENDTVVFARGDAESPKGKPDLGISFAELGVVGLDGAPERVVVHPIVSYFEFDFDGERLAWQARGCHGALLRSKPLDELVADPRLRPLRYTGRCRLRLRREARAERGHRSLTLPVDCAGFRRDCAVFRPSLRTLRSHRVGARRVPRGTRVSGRAFKIATGGRTRLSLTPVGRRLLRRPGRIRLGVRTIVGDSLVQEIRRGRITVR